MSNVILDGSGFKIFQAIRHKGDGTISNVAFHEIKFNESGPSYAGTGVAAFGSSGPVDISDSTFDEMGRIGVLYFGSGVSGSVFSANTYLGKGDGNFLDYAVEVGAGSVVTIRNNEISGNRGVASSDGSTSAGILVTTFFGPGSAATIFGNSISENTTGIAVGFDSSDTSAVTANFNNIFDNDSHGVDTTAPTVDATCNWWGALDGPSTVGPGSGDAVTADVVFLPWLISFDGRCLGPVSVGGATSYLDSGWGTSATVWAALAGAMAVAFAVFGAADWYANRRRQASKH